MKIIREFPHIFSLLTIFLWTMIFVFIVHFLVGRLSWWHYLLLSLLIALTFNFGGYFGEIRLLWKKKNARLNKTGKAKIELTKQDILAIIENQWINQMSIEANLVIKHRSIAQLMDIFDENFIIELVSRYLNELESEGFIESKDFSTIPFQSKRLFVKYRRREQLNESN